MPSFSGTSLAALRTADPRLQSIMHEVIKYFDFTVLVGYRGKEDQDKAVAEGNSKTPWPASKHNTQPSKAVDVAPYPIDWKDTTRFARLMGHIERVASEQGIKIRLGMDFTTLRDFPHVELID